MSRELSEQVAVVEAELLAVAPRVTGAGCTGVWRRWSLRVQIVSLEHVALVVAEVLPLVVPVTPLKRRTKTKSQDLPVPAVTV